MKQKIIEGDQSNWNAKIEGFQLNCKATMKQMIIKNMKITDDRKLTKEIAKFSKDRDWKDCTLTNFIKWRDNKKELKE